MTATSDKVKLYWTEEQEIFQKLFGAIFTSETPIEVINSSVFGDYKVIRSNLTSNCPDVLLFGCKYISNELLNEMRQIHTHFPSIGIVLLVSYLRHDDLLLIRQYIESAKGPFGFLFKKSLTRTEQLFSIISLVKMGQVIIDPTLTNLMSTDGENTLIARGLTAREIEILNLVAKGFTNVAISDSLCIDVKTVRHHINNIYSKLKTSDEFDNKHPRVSSTNVYLRLTGQLSFDDNVIED
jgi:DNA-binding NarL/FixJ family response regulator